MIDKPENVRIATIHDIDGLMEIARQLAPENAMAPIDEGKIRKTIEHIICGQSCGDVLCNLAGHSVCGECYRPMGVIGVIEKDGKIAGTIGFTFNQWWYSKEWTLEEKWNYVRPEYRSSTYAKDLLQFAKWLREKLDKQMLIGIISHHRLHGKIKLYRRSGLNQVGALFLF